MPEEQLMEAEAEFTRQYKFSLWWVNNKQKLKKIGYGIIIVIEAGFLAFILWTAIDTYLISYDEEIGAVNQMAAFGQADLHAFTVATAARDLSIGRVTVLSAGDGEFDLYTEITNPNADWWADFDYVFTSSAGETEPQRGFILPGEEAKPFAAFDGVTGTRPTGAEIELRNFTWHRVNHHQTGDYAQFESERLRFEISGVQLQQRVELEDGTTSDFGRVSFAVQNRGAFSFFDPEFYLVLRRGPNVVGVNRTTLNAIDAGETQQVDVNWFGTVPSASKVDVIPSINIFDPGIYKSLQ